MNINNPYIAHSITKIGFNKELHLFFDRVNKSHTDISWSNFRGIIISFIDDINSLEDLTYFIQFIRKNLGWIHKIPTTQTIDLFDEIFARLITKKRNIFKQYKWRSKYIGSIFHNLRHFQKIPIEFFEDISVLIEWTEYWSASYISEILRTIEPYRDTEYGRKFIHVIGDKLLSLEFEKLSFRIAQSLIINLEHLDIEIPHELLNRWNDLQNTEWDNNFKSTKDESRIYEEILRDYSFEGFSIERNAYICGYEVDIVIYDTQDNIFAIVESDGWVHSNSNTQEKDTRRDILFQRRGITDLIIRCKKQSNQAYLR